MLFAVMGEADAVEIIFRDHADKAAMRKNTKKNLLRYCLRQNEITWKPKGTCSL
ncbi:hypothetical protein BDF21DRAFT_427719 [Thamnidium elegans]|nr:hypothetical protein BDF21DRAFT_427719 [Thamnidium elegans]